ncbi:MAG TPA: divalent-cation tolerance protein CutA [Trueperaceae bacterium]|nr:divalent-cation tolerance protein CutA [Trueperaceae bacterium]
MAELRSVYMTFPDLDSATAVAKHLVDERLAACVNLLPRALSVYRWEGAVRSEEEVVAFAKTTAERLEALMARAAELHPYQVPCVVALHPAAASPAYVDWVAGEVTEGG